MDAGHPGQRPPRGRGRGGPTPTGPTAAYAAYKAVSPAPVIVSVLLSLLWFDPVGVGPPREGLGLVREEDAGRDGLRPSGGIGDEGRR
ncbi:hypothetical protein HKX48_000170 [Thoreauomyces humboldtii]|nr:hypothetical protein HKX48_000170 [Thoreauomyces humboldtii]